MTATQQLPAVASAATPRPWKVRQSPMNTNDCIVESAPLEGRSYRQEILGDDYFPELSKRADAELIVAAVTAYDRNQATIAQLQTDLAECYRLSGADPDGNEDWRLAPYAVQEVRRLRAESDKADAEVLAQAATIAALRDGLQEMIRVLYAWRNALPNNSVNAQLIPAIEEKIAAAESVLQASEERP